MPIDEFDEFDQREERSDLAIADLIARDEPRSVESQTLGAPTFGEQADYGQPEQYSEAEGPHGEFVEVEIVHEQSEVPTEDEDDDEGSVIEGELAEGGERTAEQGGARRRRRRRGGRRGRRGRSGQESGRSEERDLQQGERENAPPEDDLRGDSEFPVEDDLSEIASGMDEPGAESGAAETEEERKTRRKRRRRGRGGKRGPEREARPPKSKPESDEIADDEDDDNDEIVDEDHRGPSTVDSGDFDDLDADEVSSGTDKNSHRAIPSWDEAIGVIIATNMESRAKSPQERPPRGRPRRGRGQGRGGRQ